jgi:hypothetical protein
MSAGIPNQWAWNEFRKSPWSKKTIECPKPQPGHQLMPINFNGHSVKCVACEGWLIPSAMSAVIQKVNSKYFKKNVLINFVRLGGEYQRYC